MLIETRRYGLVVALIVFFLLVDGHSFADGEEPLTVCPLGCNYRDLQSAIDSAEPGGRILIKPPPFLDIPLIRKHLPDQSYKGGISIDRPLTIKAVVPHKVIIETTDWRQSPVSVQTGASQVRLKGLDIVGSGGERCTRTGTSKCSAGVEVFGDVSLTLSDCMVSRNGGFGVSVTNGGVVNVINSAIRENREGGLFYDESTSGEIIETSIEDNGRGVLAYSNDVSGFDNYLRGNGTPLVGNIDPSFRTKLRPAEDEQILYSRERYPSLQHAVDSLKPGGKLFITSGEYGEGVTVDKEMTLVSMDSSFVILDPAREFATGISVIDGGDLTVRNIQLSGGSTGMTVGRNGRVNASRMNFYNNLNGVILLNNARGTITDSQLYFNCYAGIIAYDSSQLQVVGNDFFINWVGVIAKPPGEYSGRIDGWGNKVNCKNTFLNVPSKTRDRLLSETRPEDNSGPDEGNKSE